VSATEEGGWLFSPNGPLHRPAGGHWTACGLRLTTAVGVPATVLQCAVWNVPVCVHCWPAVVTRDRP
jgi:hypothetical protein